MVRVLTGKSILGPPPKMHTTSAIVTRANDCTASDQGSAECHAVGSGTFPVDMAQEPTLHGRRNVSDLNAQMRFPGKKAFPISRLLQMADQAVRLSNTCKRHTTREIPWEKQQCQLLFLVSTQTWNKSSIPHRNCTAMSCGHGQAGKDSGRKATPDERLSAGNL